MGSCHSYILNLVLSLTLYWWCFYCSLYVPFCAVAHISFCRYCSVLFLHLAYAGQQCSFFLCVLICFFTQKLEALFMCGSVYKVKWAWKFSTWKHAAETCSLGGQEGLSTLKCFPSQAVCRFGRRTWCLDAEVDSVNTWNFSWYRLTDGYVEICSQMAFRCAFWVQKSKLDLTSQHSYFWK